MDGFTDFDQILAKYRNTKAIEPESTRIRLETMSNRQYKAIMGELHS